MFNGEKVMTPHAFNSSPSLSRHVICDEDEEERFKASLCDRVIPIRKALVSMCLIIVIHFQSLGKER
jgi:hypothetical protein